LLLDDYETQRFWASVTSSVSQDQSQVLGLAKVSLTSQSPIFRAALILPDLKPTMNHAPSVSSSFAVKAGVGDPMFLGTPWRRLARRFQGHVATMFGAAIVLSGTTASAASFVISEDIEDGSSQGQQYVGAGAFGGFVGAVFDGGNDAFDNYGRWQDPGPSGSSLSFTRRVEALTASNTYRFLDTFTNATGTTISTTITFTGNLGSDGDEAIDLSSPGITVAHESRSNGSTTDPVIAHVYGNNAFAAANMSAVIGLETYTSTANIVLAPGESIGILQFAYLSREDTLITDYGSGTNGSNTVGAYIADAIAVGNALLSNPDLSGFSQSEIASIANFSAVPEPSSVVFLSVALAMMGRRRRN
jgi:hypothetical protein